MAQNILTVLYGVGILVFGVALTAAFAKIRFTQRNILIFLGLILLSGVLQAAAIIVFEEQMVWKLYPIIAHLPLILLLYFWYHKPMVTAMISAFTAYLFCQPSKLFGVLVYHLTGSATAELAARILCLFPLAYLAIILCSPCLANIFCKDFRSVCIFGIVPTVYYLFDYATAVYTDLWANNNRVIIEFMPFFLAAFYIVFCFIYYREYEEKTEAQLREQIVRIAVEQQAKENAAIREIEQELRILRHDMRMILSSLAICIENGETDTARELIDMHITRIDGTRLKHFCANDVINYVLSDYAARCKNENIPFNCTIALAEMPVDEVMFCSILSNALDNALNAQKLLPSEKRNITVMLKNSNDRLLLSVKNPVGKKVVFSDGLPVSNKKGHGYGTQSIQYVTERLGGNCQFTVQNGIFTLRVVL